MLYPSSNFKPIIHKGSNPKRQIAMHPTVHIIVQQVIIKSRGYSLNWRLRNKEIPLLQVNKITFWEKVLNHNKLNIIIADGFCHFKISSEDRVNENWN